MGLALKGKYDDAVAMIQEALGLCGELNYDEGMAAATNAMTVVYAQQGFAEEAEDSGKDALKMFKKAGYTKGQGVALHSLAKVYVKMGDIANALKFSKDSLACFASIGDTSSVAMVYSTCSETYVLKGDTFSAARSLEKAAGIYEKLGEKTLQAMTYADMGLAKDEYVEAIRKMKSMIGYFHEAGDTKGEAEAVFKLATTMLKAGDSSKAEKVAEMCLALFYQLNDQEGMAKGKGLVDSCKQANVVEEIEVTVSKYAPYYHDAKKFIVDPELGQRVQEKYLATVKAK